MNCPKCNSMRVVYTGLGFDKLTYRCNKCGHTFSKERKDGEYIQIGMRWEK